MSIDCKDSPTFKACQNQSAMTATESLELNRMPKSNREEEDVNTREQSNMFPRTDSISKSEDVAYGFLERATYEAMLIKIKSIEDLYARADFIYRTSMRGRCERSRALIRSVAEAGVAGCLVQAQMNALPAASDGVLKSLVRQNQQPFRKKRKSTVKQRGSALFGLLLTRADEQRAKDEA